jgi:hypothetical protein
MSCVPFFQKCGVTITNQYLAVLELYETNVLQRAFEVAFVLVMELQYRSRWKTHRKSS